MQTFPKTAGQGQDQAAIAENAGQGSGERLTNRDRVRQKLFEPLGFRSPKGTASDAERAMLDAVADELAYLTDADLQVMVGLLKVHGEGAARCFWPSRATFTSFAHIVRARPLSQDPTLRRWWASVEGQRMVLEGTLVETYQYFEKNRMPPVRDGARSQILASAQESARRLQLIEERERLDYPIAADELAWRKRYVDRRQELVELIAEVRANRDGVSA